MSLIDAVKAGEAGELLRALMRGGSVDERDDKRRTPLHLASLLKDPRCAQGLLAAGADPFARDCHGRTPLHLAAAAAHGEVVRVLLSADRETACALDDSQRQPVHCARLEGDLPALRQLLDAGFYPNSRDREGQKAVEAQALGGQWKSVKLMCAYGAAPEAAKPALELSELKEGAKRQWYRVWSRAFWGYHGDAPKLLGLSRQGVRWYPDEAFDLRINYAFARSARSSQALPGPSHD